MKWVAFIIGCVLCFLEIVVVIAYFKTFNGSISLDNQAWNTFGQVFNGFVMAVLTGLNILIFYKISNSIEENTKNRAAKQTLFEAQLIITQMRVKRYEELRLLIDDIMIDSFRDNINEERIEQLKKALMKMDISFIFRTDNIEDGSIVFPKSQEILNLIEKREDGYMNELSIKLTSLITLMELYIFTQMLKNSGTEEYMDNHKGEFDSVFSCIDQYIRNFHASKNKPSSNQ